MNLYWITTPDGYENWFAFAKTKRQVEKFHENAEGFDNNYANAELVCRIPKELCDRYELTAEGAGWPSNELLKELGGKFDTEDNPRIINFFGKVFIEGTFTEGIFFNEIKIKSGVYVIKVQNSKKYKIGITINIKKRLKPFSTGNPFNLKLLYFIETLHYKSLEKHLHNVFKEYRIKGEWFNFDDSDLQEIEYTLAHIANTSDEFILHNIKNASIQGRVY
jgi:hypothetical protein